MNLSHRSMQCAVGVSAVIGIALLGCASHRDSSNPKELWPGFNECVATATDPSTCVNLGVADPGSRPMTQKMCDDAEAGLEFLPLPIWDMGPVPTSGTQFVDGKFAGGDPLRPTALGWYSYDDNTTPFRVPGKVYEPTTDQVFRCGKDNPNPFYALHLYGGPFQEWGGGFGRTMKCMNTDSTDANHNPWLKILNINKYLCGARTTSNFRIDPTMKLSLAACSAARVQPAQRTAEQQMMMGLCPQRDLNYLRSGKADEADEPYMTGMALDLTDHVMTDPMDPNAKDIQVRGWEGIAFWARRSPNSQPGIRVSIADKFVDDDMMYLSEKYDPNRPRYCERAQTCNCNNNKPCTPLQVDYLQFDVDGNRVKYAYDPKDTDQNHCKKVPALDAEGRSLINLSNEVVLDANGKQRTWPDGSTVTPYNGCPTDPKSQGGIIPSGQPEQTDVRALQTYGFCFDPAVDPTPPPGTRAELVNHRVFSDPWAFPATTSSYEVCGGEFFTSAYPEDSWIKFFCNTDEVAGYNYTVCGDNACNLEYPSFQAPDPWFHGKKCQPYSFVGSITRGYCYDPDSDRHPPEGTQACGDYWMRPVDIGVDWTFIKVPFSSLLQQGWAKRQYQIDLSSITNIRFQWERGWMDYQISDVRFYRTKQ